MKFLILMAILFSVSAFSQDEGEPMDASNDEPILEESISDEAQEPAEEPVQDEMDQ